MLRQLSSPLYKLLERSGVYALGQWIGQPTVKRFRQLIRENIALSPQETLLDLGCGVGGYRECFTGRYHGIDINPHYISTAQARYAGDFRVMSCTDLEFKPGIFDHVVTIATTHHLSDDELVRTVTEARRVCRRGGVVHIIDAVLPTTYRDLFKYLWFRMDRGNFPRPLDALMRLANKAGRVTTVKTLSSPLHLTCYLRIQ
jgi:SAM-dependent methyltransferase